MRVVTHTGRYGGQRFGWLPDPEVFRPTARTPEPSPPAEPARPAGVSARAFALGLRTLADVEAEYRLSKTYREKAYGWSNGREYHCSLCDKDFGSASGAFKHARKRGCPVLRMDYPENDRAPLPWTEKGS